MSNLEAVIDQLWLHNTFAEDPWAVDRAFAAIRDEGEVAIDGLISALGHKDLGLKLLDEDRLVRIAAVETFKVQILHEKAELSG